MTTQTAEHTPGPWAFDVLANGDRAIVSDSRIVATLGTLAPTEPDARLIAAAPEMYEALRSVVAVYDRVSGPLAVDPMVATTRALLARIEGEG